MSNFALDNEYQQFLIAAKQQYKSAQLKAAYAVNTEMIRFYWQLGSQFIDNHAASKWGSKLLPQFSRDMQIEFPGAQGFSLRNLQYMKRFAEAYPAIVQQPVAQLSCCHVP